MFDNLKMRFNWMRYGKIDLKTELVELTVWKKRAFVLKAVMALTGCAFYHNPIHSCYPAITLELNGKAIGVIFGKAVIKRLNLTRLIRLAQQPARWTVDQVYFVIYQNVAYRSTHPVGQALLSAIKEKADPDIALLLFG